MSANHRQRAEELLAFSNKAGCTNEEAALAIAEAQVHATLALSNDSAPAKPTGWVYRVTVDYYPTPDGRPFIDMDDDFYITQVYLHANPNEGDLADWLPDSFGEWIYGDASIESSGEPAKIGRTLFDGYDDGVDGFGMGSGRSLQPILKVPFTRRRHWLSASTARGIVAGLREWGAEVRLERCPLNAWEVVA